jgi:HK97 family phage major capsid protein
MKTLYELKTNLSTVGAELQKIASELMEKAANPSIPIEEIDALQNTKANLQKRYDLIKNEHDKLEADQKARLEKNLQKDNIANAKDDKERLIAAKAAYYRAVILKQPIPDDVQAIIKAIPGNDTSGGANFLPSTLSNELVHEPFTKNPLRGIIRMSNIKGLEIPKIAFSLGDDSFINDDAAAKEIAATGNKQAFGRYKFKVKVAVPDTIIHGSDLNLVSYIENALKSGLAAKEKKVSFAAVASQVSGEEHMSFYQDSTTPGTPVIKEVGGADLYEAITNSIADLHEDFRENAKVVMKYTDYVTMLKELSNGSMDLYQAQPEKIIGKPVIFCDSATTPIVGDFNYCVLNYDGEPIYDADKDVDKGNYIWVLTAWFDQHRLLNSAFRLAVVEEEEGQQ